MLQHLYKYTNIFQSKAEGFSPVINVAEIPSFATHLFNILYGSKLVCSFDMARIHTPVGN